MNAYNENIKHYSMMLLFFRRILADTEGSIFSGDEFFINSKGEYVWDANLLSEAHAWNQNRGKNTTPSLI